jgi:hypothetical protein
MNEFEQKISRQPLKRIPREWRAEILAATKSVSVPGRKEFDAEAKMISWWRELFWPHPKAWGALAAVWIFIFIVNFSTRDKSPAVAEKISPPSPEVAVELKKQQLLFAELMGPRDWPDGDRPKTFSPKPRSEREALLTA